MSIARLYQQVDAQVRASARFTCVDYQPSLSGNRCEHYQDGGTCARPDRFLCEEWERRNRPSSAGGAVPNQAALRTGARPEIADAQLRADANAKPVTSAPESQASERFARDLFGNPIVEQPAPPPKSTKASAQPVIKAPEPAVINISRLRGFTTDDIESFRALGVEVCLFSEDFGELWLVPTYTNQARKELTPEHAATLLHVMHVFPGARVTAFHERQPKAAQKAQEGA